MLSAMIAAALMSAPTTATLRVDVNSIGQSSAVPRHYVLVATETTAKSNFPRAPIDAALRAKGWVLAKPGEKPDAWVAVGFYSAELYRGNINGLDAKRYRSLLTLQALDKAPAAAGPHQILWQVATSTITRDDDYPTIYSALVSAAQRFVGRSAAPQTSVTLSQVID